MSSSAGYSSAVPATKSPSPPLFDGSIDLKTQMLAARRSAQNVNKPAASLSQLNSSFVTPLPGQQTTTEGFDQASLLSRMVTAQSAGVGVQPIRMVASMQHIRRSRNSLTSVPESNPRAHAPNQIFNTNRRATSGGASGGLPTVNPLLKAMEERMAAKKASTAASNDQKQVVTTAQTSDMSGEAKAALHASISKWGGLAMAASGGLKGTVETVGGSTSFPSSKPALNYQPQSKPSTPNIAQERVPLNPNQIDLLRQLTSSDQSMKKENMQRVSQNELLQQVLLQHSQHVQNANNATFNLQRQNWQQQQINSSLPMGAPQPRSGMTRCAVSLAEVDRLRRENQSIQLQRQLLIQERMQNELHYQQQCNIAASALASSSNLIPAGISQEDQNKLQEMTKQSSFRKRRSWGVPDSDDDISLSSRTPSITSSASSHKIHRSLSHSSARKSLENLRIGSMGNLRTNKSFMNNPGMLRNQSFSSSGAALNHVQSNKNLSFSSGLNQSFSTGSGSGSSSQHRQQLLQQQQQIRSSTQLSSQEALASSSTLKRHSSSNNYIKSLLVEQNTAGKAAATSFELTKQVNNVNVSVSRSSSQQNEEAESPNDTQFEGLVLSNKPIQVTTEECCAPPIERPASTNNSEIIIMSQMPDRIKYQNDANAKKPLEVVKEILSSSGANSDTKPSIDVTDFFVKVDTMYDQDVVNAIRSNDVDALRKLHSEGTNLECGNRFGETLIHLACRRSSRELVAFLVQEAGVSILVRDDFGRTPMHDCCWRPEIDLELLDMLLDLAPELLLLSDKRGHTPLDYSRREHWDKLIPFLHDKKDKLVGASK